VVLEIIGVAAIIIGFLVHAQRGPGVVDTSAGLPAGSSPYLFAWLASGLMAAYVMVGFDSAGELSEETHNPKRTAPRTIIRALIVSGVGGGLLIVTAIMAAPSLTDGKLATLGLPWVLTQALGPIGGRILLVDVAIAVCVCTLAVQTSGSRMVFSMAREKALPFHQVLSKVSPRTGTPIATSIVVGVGAALVLLVNIGESALFTALASLCIGLLYLAYLGVTVPLLVKRIRDARAGISDHGLDETGKPLFSLGRWGIPINVVAVLYQVVFVINLMWPRPEIYDLTGHTWWLQWSALLFLGVTLLIGLAIHIRNRTRHGVLVLGTIAVTPTTQQTAV
jgi:urea carboxylase system permease